MQLDVPVVGILRGVEIGFFGEIMAAAFEGGLQAIEVTFNTPRADEIVKTYRKRLPDGKLLGMGTIRNLDEARTAIAAGAMFLVTPNTDPAVIAYAVALKVPIIAGGFTPTEVYSAWSAGAAMVKVFPCASVGPPYISELRGPFEQIPLVAVGGVCADNVKAYFNAGAAAVGVGASLFGRKALEEKSPESICLNVRQFLEQVIQ